MKVRREACDGTGVVTTMEPARIKGCKLASSVHTTPVNRFCTTCRG